MRKLCVCAALMMILLWRSCWAQASRASEIDHRWEINGGLALTGPNPSNARSGGGGGLGWYPVRWLGVQGDCSVVFQGAGGGNNTTLTDFLIGPRLGKQASGRLRVSPFVDLLFGLQHMNNSSSQHTYYYATGWGAAQAVDGGLDVRLTSRLAIRAQAGGVFSHFAVAPGSTNGATNIRWRAGAYIVYRF